MIKKTLSLSGKITIILVFSLLGLCLLHAAPVPHVTGVVGTTAGGTMQGAGAGAGARQPAEPNDPHPSGFCATLKQAELQISAGSLFKGINIADISSALLGDMIFPVASGMCSFYSSTIQFLENQDFIFGTGGDVTYNQEIVKTLWYTMEGIAGSVLALMWLFVGYNVMRGESVSSAVPRLVLATLMAFGSYPIASKLIDLESVMCHAVIVASSSMPNGFNVASAGADIVGLFLAAPVPEPSYTTDLATTLPSLLILIEGIAVGFEMIIRVAIIDLLLVTSPVLICYGLPQWQRWANLWVMAFFSVLFVQFVQVVAICLGSNLTRFFGGSTVMALFVGIAMLYLVMKIPGWFGGLVSSTLAGVPTPYDVANQAMRQATEAATGVAKTAAGALI